MSLKIFKAYTKSTRGTVMVDRKNLWRGKSLKSLTLGKNSTGGRNNLGRITSRSKGAGHKNKYRQIDFYRKKDNLKAKVERIEYDPNRSAHVALIKYEDGIKNYILAPNRLKVGDEISGHFLYGHVDYVTKVSKIHKLDSSWVFEFKKDKNNKDMEKFIVEKGSIAINGISLTVTNVTSESFSISIIPHTFDNTNLNEAKENDLVNIEFDPLARYVLKND